MTTITKELGRKMLTEAKIKIATQMVACFDGSLALKNEALHQKLAIQQSILSDYYRLLN